MAVETVDFFISPQDGWVLVAADPALLVIKPSIFRPWRLAMTASGAPAALSAATGVLTLSGNAQDAETVTIGSRTYTFQDVLVDAPDNVLVGATASDSIDNLVAAITGGAGEGVIYGTGTAPHADVTAAAGAGDTMDVAAKAAGASGNGIATTETLANGSFGAATLTGGADELRGLAFGSDEYNRRPLFEHTGALTAEVYIRVVDPIGHGEPAHFGVIRDQA